MKKKLFVSVLNFGQGSKLSKCRVCEVSKFLSNHFSGKYVDDWLNDGLNLEGNTIYNNSRMDHLKYKIHFIKPYQYVKYKLKEFRCFILKNL